jgi:hypothetical protein
MDLNNFDAVVQENIQTLLTKREIEKDSPAFGIAMQVSRQGFRSLSWKQRFIYLEELEPLLRKHGLAVGGINFSRQPYSDSET